MDKTDKNSMDEADKNSMDDRWCCAACGSDQIDGFQGQWQCLECNAVWMDTDTDLLD